MSCYLKFIQSEPFQTVYKQTEGISQEEALTRDFFLGVFIINPANITQIITIEPSAFSAEMIQKKLKDERYCKKCLQFDKHTFVCKNSGWYNFTNK